MDENMSQAARHALRNTQVSRSTVSKKIKALDGIQTLIWHANADNAVEGSLNLGLHYRHDDPDRPWGRKPAWYVFQAFGTEHESEVLDQYLPVIGVSQWSEIMHQVNE